MDTQWPLEVRKRLDPELIDSMIGQLQERIGDIVVGLLETYRARIPSYAAAPPDFIEEVHLGTTTSFQVGLEILRNEVDPELMMAPLEELGRRRARQGIPLGDALLAWQISAHTFWRCVAELAPEDPAVRADVMLLASEVIMQLLELAASAISSGYLDIERARVADEEFDSQTVVETLAGVRSPDELFDGASERLGVDPKGLDRCVVSEVDGHDVGATIRGMRSTIESCVVGRIDEYAVAFCAGEPKVAEGARFGVARSEADDGGYARARAALKVALLLERNSARYEDVAPLALILDAPDADRDAFVEAQLGPALRDPSGDELLRSLAEYYASGQSVAGAARALHVHRHTLEYRLDRLEKLLGPRIKEPTGRMLVELALSLARKDG
jgi:hypothetical protein